MYLKLIKIIKNSMFYKMFNPKQEKVFDWHKAIGLIKKNNLKNCSAGLKDDENTFGVILIDGIPQKDNFHYLQSYWATPVLKDLDKGVDYDCWSFENDCPEFNAKSDWTDELENELIK